MEGAITTVYRGRIHESISEGTGLRANNVAYPVRPDTPRLFEVRGRKKDRKKERRKWSKYDGCLLDPDSAVGSEDGRNRAASFVKTRTPEYPEEEKTESTYFSRSVFLDCFCY